MTTLKVIIVGFIIISLSFLFYLFTVNEQGGSSAASEAFISYEHINLQIGNMEYILYISDSSEKRQQGLSDITSMESDEGMIFVFKNPSKYSFWMKDMNFPLDFIYLHENIVVDLIENVMPETYPESIVPDKEASMIIELNKGEISLNNIKIGDTLAIPQSVQDYEQL